MLTFYLISILCTLAHAFVDYLLIKKNKAINHTLESLIYSSVVFFFVWFLKQPNFWHWFLYCAITVTIIRAGWFDFALNAMRGKSLWYVSPIVDGTYKGNKESWYDEMLYKLNIHPSDVRISCFVLSIIWAFTFKYFF